MKTEYAKLGKTYGTICLRRTLLTVILSCCCLFVHAKITISGKITDTRDEPLPALVTVLADGTIVEFCNAGEDGKYSIEFEPSHESILIKVSLLGFLPVEKMIAAKSGILDIVMEEGVTELKEVTVIADNITQRGDTLSYHVGAYKDANDRVIGDVIKKMPGLEVSESGKISFNGKTVKNFYVEDMDLLEGRYGIATNNISANDIASVQVYQNHQPIRALQDWSPTDDITINLKLKSSARGTFSMNGMAGAGYKPMMWAAEAVAMYFGKKSQTITTYKGNNSGDNINAEQNNHTNDGAMQFFNRAPLSVVSPGSPGVALKRYLNNRSNTVSTNNIFKLDSLTTLNLSVAYLDDIIRNNGSITTEQYLPSGDYRWIKQEISMKSYVHNLRGFATFKRNTSSFYLSNSLYVDAGWNKDNGRSITSTSFMDNTTDVNQHLDNPSFCISDRFSLITNNESRSWNIDMNIGWNHRPQSLSVKPASIFGEGVLGEEVSQAYTTDDFRAQVQTGLSHRFGKLIFDTFIFGNIDIEKVSSELDGFKSSALDNTSNGYVFGKGELGIEPRIGYSIGELYLEFRIPVGYNGQWLRDRLDQDRNRGWTYLNFNPALKMTHRLGKSWWGISSSFYRMRDNSGRVAPGIVMTDFLSFREYLIDKTMRDNTWYNTLEYHYANAMLQLFGNAEASWLRSSQNIMTGYEYEGLVTVRNVYDVPFVSNRYSATANINKGLSFWESTLKIGGNYSLNTSKQIINKEPVDYKAQYWSANLMFATTPVNWMGAALGFAYGENKSFTALTKSEDLTIRQYTGRLDLNFFPTPRFVINVAVEDNYTNMTEKGKHSWFGDIKLKYKTGRFDWELEFNNIFNRREFTRINYTDMDIYCNTYQLRPRNIMLKVRFSIL